MAKITVICRNEDCTMLNQPQEVEKSEMVCPECGEPVIPFDGGKKNWWEENKKLVGLIAAAIILLGGGGFGIFKACVGGAWLAIMSTRTSISFSSAMRAGLASVSSASQV